jgi:hypothetical protein
MKKFFLTLSLLVLLILILTGISQKFDSPDRKSDGGEKLVFISSFTVS